MKNKVQPQGLTAMADAAHQFHRIEGMENTWISRDDKTDGGILDAAGQTLGSRVGPELHLPYDLLYALDDLFIDGGDFVEDARNSGDGNIGLAGDISYTYFFFHCLYYCKFDNVRATKDGRP